MKKMTLVLAGAVLAAAAGAAHADGRIWAQDASGRYNGVDGSGGAFIVHRIGNSVSGGTNFTQSNSNAYHTSQNNAGYVGSSIGDNNLLGLGQFYSFCIEVGESLNPANANNNGNRYFAEIGDSARNGGSGTSNAHAPGPRDNGANEDVISFATAAIYREFRMGGNFGGAGSILGGYGALGTLTREHNSTSFNAPALATETAGRRMASAIQWALWYAEDEIDWNHRFNDSDNAYIVRELGRQIFDWANDASVHGNTLGNVRVLRLWTSYNATTGVYSGNRQDLLTLIPLPSGVGLAMAGLGLMAIRRRSIR